MVTRTALVTGATGAIGGAIARRLADVGFDIKVTGRDRTAIEACCEAIRRRGRAAEGLPADLSAMSEVDALADWACADAALEAVVMVAGAGASAPVGPEAVDEWDGILDTILRAQMRLAAKTLPRVRERQGIYVFLAGMLAKTGMRNAGGYAAARHGIQGFAESMFEDVREDGVRVSLIHPGFVNTPLIRSDRLDRSKMIQTEDIATLVEMLVRLPPTACVVETLIRPQRSPYPRDGASSR